MSLGLKKSKSRQQTTFGVRRTPFSDLSNGVLSLDSSIRGIQDRSLAGVDESRAGFGSGVGGVLQNLNQTRESLLGNQGLFQRARVDPVRDILSRRRGQLTSGISQRGLSGSSFADQALSGFDVDAAREIGNASALADAESLYAITGIDRDTLNVLIGKATVEAQQRGEDMQVARDRLQQELASFNFGKGGEATSKSFGFSVGGLSTGSSGGSA